MTGVTAIVLALLVGDVARERLDRDPHTLAFATGIGLINGFVVVLTKLPSFFVTLARVRAGQGRGAARGRRGELRDPA